MAVTEVLHEAMEHQVFGIEHLNRFPRALVADEQGVGKTLICFGWWMQSKCRTLVIVCPASTVGVVWRKECARHGIKPIIISAGSVLPEPTQANTGEKRVLICSYGMLAGRKTKNSAPKPPLSDWLRRWTPDALFIDECQSIQDQASKQTKAVRKVAAGIKHVVGISGTPGNKTPKDFFSALNLLWPGEFPSFHAYANYYCKPERNFWGWTYDGAENLDHLHARLIKCGMLRRRLADVLPDLKLPIWHVVPCDMRNPEEYQEAQHSFLEWLSKIDPEKAARAAMAEAVVRTGYLQRLATRLSFRAKLQWLKDWLEANPTRKIAVYCVQTAAIRAVMRACTTYDDAGNVVDCFATCVDGSTRDREGAVMAFQTDPRIRVFVGQMVAAGAGIPLTACHHLALLEFPYVPAVLGQVVARPRRIGQTEQVHIHCLVAHGTIEEHQCSILQRRQGHLSTILDGVPSNGDSSMPIHSELLKQLGRKS